MADKKFSMTEKYGFSGYKIIFKTNLLKEPSFNLYYRKLYSQEQLKWARQLVVYFITTNDWGTRSDYPYSYVDCAVAKFRKKLGISVFQIRAFREAATVAFLAGRKARNGLKLIKSTEIRKNPNWHTFEYNESDDCLYKKGCEELQAYTEQSLVTEAERLPFVRSQQEIETCICLAREYGTSSCAGCTSGIEEEDKVMSGMIVSPYPCDEPFDPNNWFKRLMPSESQALEDEKAKIKRDALEWFSSLPDDRKEQLLIIACEANRRVNYEQYDRLRDKYSGAFKTERFIWELSKVVSEFTRGQVPVSDMGRTNPLPEEIKNKACDILKMLICGIIAAIIVGSCLKIASKPPYGDQDPPEDWPYNF